MARLTGKAGAATVGSLTGLVITGWEFEETGNNVTSTAAGDTVVHREPLQTDWSGSITWYLSDTPAYSNIVVPVNTNVAISLKFLASDTNPVIVGTGLVSRFRVAHPADGMTTCTCEVIASSGTFTIDTTPAS